MNLLIIISVITLVVHLYVQNVSLYVDNSWNHKCMVSVSYAD